MPILPKERDILPRDLLDEDATSGPGRWLVFHALARREKDLMRKQTAAAVPFSGPLIPRRLRSVSGRTRTSFAPLFPGSVFCRAEGEQRRAGLATNCVTHWIPTPDERMLEQDLRAIKRLVDTEQPLAPEARLATGAPVRVRSGPLLGIKGPVVKRRGPARLVVAVRSLNHGASIEPEDVDLVPL